NIECVARPSSSALLEQVVKQALRATRSHAERALAPIRPAYHGIIGESPQMVDIFARITKVAVGDVNVCIHGESGTGKELIARAIHYASPRRDRPLITLDCTTIPEGLMESHLFGHVKGAFTGATEHREGVFALAHTGTLFIDELGELSPRLQAKLLRVIQTREFSKVGGSKPLRTDLRLITATNKDLKAAVVLAEGATLTDRDLFAGDFSSTVGATANPVLSGQFEPGLPLSEVERRHILRTLQKVHGNRTEAARLLQISVRCLQYKLKAYGRDGDAVAGSSRGLVPSSSSSPAVLK